MKVGPRDTASFMKQVPAHIRAVLVYGPDAGQVAERARALAAGVVGDINDPFSVAEVTNADIKADPARLVDEATAISFGGGGRVVRLRDGADGATDACRGVLDYESDTGSLLVVEGGDLGPRSSLRKLFEGAENAAALACYLDDARAIGDVVRETLKTHGITVRGAAMALLSQSLGSDRMQTRSELEKLALYMGGPGEVSEEDVLSALSDGSASNIDDVVFAAAAGDIDGLDRALEKTFAEGTHAVQVVRGAQRHFQRLHLARGMMSAGESADGAMARLRPPVFFKMKEGFRRQLDAWPAERLGRAFEILTEAELDCKTTGLPSEAICHRALIQLAQAARSARQRH